ncbi:MAG TPA: hypothetical protein VF795_03260 [Desulfuromonadaceae bacterium]
MRRGNLQTRLYLGSAATLLLGLGASVIIYLTAGEPQDDVLEQIEGTKPYLRSLELYGGTANVLATELTNRFAALWHGRPLAYTLGCLTLLLSFGLFFVGYHSPPDAGPDDRDENNRGKPDGPVA